MSRVLLADIGGTYARFTVARGGDFGDIWSTEVNSHLDVSAAIAAFRRSHTEQLRLDGALIAAAGAVEGGRCKLTNAAWTIDEDVVARTHGLGWVKVVNDLEAVAAGLPDLEPKHLKAIGGGPAIPGAPMAIVSPGTGLGVGCLFNGPGGRCVLPSEGGHATLGGTGPSDERIVRFLRQKYGHVSAERALSGCGLSDLHQAIASNEGQNAFRLPPSEVTARAFDGSSPVCREAVDLFCGLLGAFAGDIALTFGARGGVFVGGGIVHRFVDYVARSDFRKCFEAKGRMLPYLRHVKTSIILHPNPAFVGLLSLLSRADRNPRAPAL